MRVVRCFDPLHATRVGQPGHSNKLGERPDIPDGPDVVVPGLFCDACGRVFLAARIVETEAERTSRRNIVTKFLAQNPTWTRAELRHFLSVREDD